MELFELLILVLSFSLLGAVYHRGPGDELEFTAAAAIKSGGLLTLASKTYQMQGLGDAAIGDLRVARKGIIVEIDKNNAADVFAVGATVGYINASQNAALAGAGDFNITGKAVKASAAGATTVFVELDR